ncbi:M20/M25/M40 family metallo-hydrolase [Alkalitalea saponilacus]|nr:M20/M25/M40 family metallo-hydrolase [Alkalitalea saponilacus]ASB50068.1 peptidase M28 [Alkalitalea saponilacus]
MINNKLTPKMVRTHHFLITLLFLIFVSGNLYSQELRERLETHVTILAADSLEGRGLGTRGKDIARDYIRNQFAEIGLTSFKEDYFHHFEFRSTSGVIANIYGTNVVGFLKGHDSKLKDEYIVIGAHYDHLGYEMRGDERVIFPGADDNASGVSLMLEMARYFATNPESHGRSLIFVAFDAEESGLIGSRWFIEDERFASKDIKTMFSLDMVGMYRSNEGLNLKGIGSIAGGEELAGYLAGNHNLILRKQGSRIEERTDTWYFGLAGIPSVHVHTGPHSPYHQPGDLAHLLQYEEMAKVKNFTVDLVKILSFQESIEPSGSFLAQSGNVRFDFGAVAMLGRSRHLYPDEFFTADDVFGFGAGFFLRIHMGQKIVVQPEVLYDYNGSKSPEGSFRRHSVMLPLNIQYNLMSMHGGIFRMYPFAGGYYQHHFNGKNGGETIDFSTYYKDHEWGFQYGLGIDMLKFHLGFVYHQALTGVADDDLLKIRSSSNRFRIGYRF